MNILQSTITTLQSECDRLRALVPVWVSVEERLPTKGQRCQFIVKSINDWYNGQVYGGKYTGTPGEHDQFEFACPGISFTASHWALILEPIN